PTAPPHICALSLHDALPISAVRVRSRDHEALVVPTDPTVRKRHPTVGQRVVEERQGVRVRLVDLIDQDDSAVLPRVPHVGIILIDRKSTRLNSSHVKISYAV